MLIFSAIPKWYLKGGSLDKEFSRILSKFYENVNKENVYKCIKLMY